MELRSKRILSTGPLPGGDRRGAPGADAGCLSMRSIGGVELNRRVPSDKNATADLSLSPPTAEMNLRQDRQTNDNNQIPSPISVFSEPYSATTSSYSPSTVRSESIGNSSHTPSLDVAREAENAFFPASTKAGKQRVRMTWSSEVNIFIMRTYYRLTNLETDMTGYRRALYEEFKNHYPNVNVSEQRISDQRRVIVRNKRLNQDTLKRIQEEVKAELQAQDDSYINTLPSNTTNYTQISPINSPPSFLTQLQTCNDSNACPITHSQIENETPNQGQTGESPMRKPTIYLDSTTTNTITKIKDIFQTILKHYQTIEPTNRPRLPKLRYSKELTDLICLFNNHILNHFISEEKNLGQIHTLVYCTAIVITKELKVKIHNVSEQTQTKNSNSKPAWQIRLENDITKLRSDIGKVTQYIHKNNRSTKVVRRVEEIFKNMTLHTRHEEPNKTPEEFLDTLKQKLTLKSQRLRRYKKSQMRKDHNKIFNTNERIFYRKLGKDTENLKTTTEQPSKEKLEEFWANIWEKKTHYNTQAMWIKKEEQNYNNLEEMSFKDITEEDINCITHKLHNWKSPGIDNIHGFWFKKLHVLHKYIAKNFTDIIKGKQLLPQFVTEGVTYMIPKGSHTSDPSKYRPITCLPTIYKILTSAIRAQINTHIEKHNIIAEEQKGCRKGHMGCKEQLIIDSTIHRHAIVKKKDLHCTYIDYKKAFDSIPHSWLVKTLEIYKINSNIITFLKQTMLQWNTSLHLGYQSNKISTRKLDIRRGIYQGDSLSPLWFCLALNPLSQMLNSHQAGFKFKQDSTETDISHLIYMDDIKLYSKSTEQMKKLITITTEFSNDINMEFGLDKCKTVHIIKGKIQPGDYMINQTQIIAAMEPSDLYKYLGYHQLKGIDHATIKNTLSAEYTRRIATLCKTQLNSKNLIKAINTYAIPILTYSFGIIKWNKTNITKIERKTRTTLTKHNYLHPKSATERLTIKRTNGGRGLIKIQALLEKQIDNLRAFFHKKSESSNIHKTIAQSDNNYTPLNLAKQTNTQPLRSQAYEIVQIEEWKSKSLHGRHPHDLLQPNIDAEASNKWLITGTLFPETEGFIIAIQDQVINTKNYRKHIIKDRTILDDRCRKCHVHAETIQHISGACPNLAQTDYTHRHNQVTSIIHQNLALKHKLILDNPTPYYKYKPNSILENRTHKLYYDRAILTDKTIHYNRPDIVLLDKAKKTTYIIDIAIPNTHNLTKTITEKIHKYTELKEEITRIWNQQKVYIIPIVLSTTGVIPKHLHSSLRTLQLKEYIYSTLQKACILNTCRIVRKFLQEDQTH